MLMRLISCRGVGSDLRSGAVFGLLLVTAFGLVPRLADADEHRSPPRGFWLDQLGTGWMSRLGQGIEAAWPNAPESVAMLSAILQGSQLGPGEGWFKKAVAQTRYDWTATARRLDRDGDGRIGSEEYPGPQSDFQRLDRNGDGVLDESDFDFSAHALMPSPGAMVFSLVDRDGNGKVTRDELDQFFRMADRDGVGFLSLADLQRALPMPERRPSASGPSRWTLLKGLIRQEIGALGPGPGLDALAPDFTLRPVDGGQEVTLSKVVGPKPVVLIFGNITCGPFRNQAGNIEKLYRRYHDRATFLMVYVREAHPIDGWQMESNERVGVKLPQPRSDQERMTVAQMCNARLGLGFPILVDTIEDPVGTRYSGMPSRLYLLDHRGRVAYKSGRGPFGFKPAELEHSLILLLQDEFPELNPHQKPTSATTSQPPPHGREPGSEFPANQSAR